MIWRRALPQPVRDVVAGTGERVLAYGVLAYPQSGYVVATQHAVHYPQAVDPLREVTQDVPGGGGAQWRRIPWDRIIRAGWSEEFLDLLVSDPQRPAGRTLRLRFDEPGEIPEVVRERITWTVVASQQVMLRPPGASTRKVLVSARRSPLDGSIRWSVAYPADSAPVGPEYVAAADRAIEDLAGRLGIG